jgi:hypothetical protein
LLACILLFWRSPRQCKSFVSAEVATFGIYLDYFKGRRRFVENQTSLDWGDEQYDGESNKLHSIGLQLRDTFPLPEN